MSLPVTSSPRSSKRIAVAVQSGAFPNSTRWSNVPPDAIPSCTRATDATAASWDRASLWWVCFGFCWQQLLGKHIFNTPSSPVVPAPLWHACRTALTSVASSTTTATHTRDVLLTSSTLCRTCGSATREPHCVVSYITRRSICLSRCLSLSLCLSVQYLCRAWQTMPWMSLIKWGCLILCPSVRLSSYSISAAVSHGEWGDANSCAARLCQCDLKLSMCLRRYYCPRNRNVCTASPWRLLQNFIMDFWRMRISSSNLAPYLRSSS